MARRNSTTQVTDEVTPDEATETEAPKTSYTVKDLCAAVKAEPKAFRRWLRTQTDDRAGRGGRWSFDQERYDALIERYNNRAASKATEPTLKGDEPSDEG